MIFARSQVTYFALLIASFLLISSSSRASERHPLRIGAARVDITPSNLHDLNSFGGDFKDVHDPIYARALVMDNGVSTAVIVALDVVEVGDMMPVRQRIQKETGIPSDHIIITASHDHNAPRVGSVTPGGLAHPETKATLDFSAMVYDRIVEAVKTAKASLEPAKVGISTGSADVNINRDEFIEGHGWTMGYNPNRPSEKTVWVMKFVSNDGQPIAILFNYAVHSTVTLGSGRLGGDLGGAAARFVEARYGNKIVALYTMGPAGDQNPRIMFSGNGGGPRVPGGQTGAAGIADAFESVNALGLVLGYEVVRVADAITDLSGDANIAAGEKIVSCAVKQGVNQLGDIKQAQVASMPLHLSLILVNDIAITSVSGEVVTNIYLHLKKASPLANTFMLTIANDRAGYIADDAAYDTPYFEVNGTPFARGCAEPSIVNGLVGLINENR
jgi:hypothetical protein